MSKADDFMRHIYGILILVIAIPTLIYHSAGAEGLSSLVEVGDSIKDIQVSNSKETGSFDRIKTASGARSLSGKTKASIESEFGFPVIKTFDHPGLREKWVYMPSSSSFFSGPKIYVYYDRAGIVDEVQKREG